MKDKQTTKIFNLVLMMNFWRFFFVSVLQIKGNKEFENDLQHPEIKNNTEVTRIFWIKSNKNNLK